MSIVVVIIYFLVLLFIFLFSITEFRLALKYLNCKNDKNESVRFSEKQFPLVTIQLPIYNELYVVERLIDAVVLIEWPKDRVEIQVLDDSDDLTSTIVEKKVAHYRAKGFDVQHIRRDTRDGFKAGALEYGTSICKGEFVAIFDADFLPDPHFLKKTICCFEQQDIGMVQTKWEHLNTDYSLLTKMQAFALDTHFTVEQKGRNQLGYFMNFNGTAGVWRKSCIESAGGWESDTLTEDLDLSYRAQMKGWKFMYREDVKSPAELPITMSALRTQQFRWSKGAAECARKNLLPVFKTSSISLLGKINAFFHLMNSTIYVCMLILILLTLPIIHISFHYPFLALMIQYSTIFFISTILLAFTYFVANNDQNNRFKSFIKNVFFFPVFLSLCMGIAFYISIGVIEGFLGIKSAFIRTPKFNITDKVSNWKANQYLLSALNPLFIFDIAILIYAIIGIYYSYQYNIYFMIIFLIMIVFGFSYSSINTIKHAFIKKV